MTLLSQTSGFQQHRWVNRSVSRDATEETPEFQYTAEPDASVPITLMSKTQGFHVNAKSNSRVTMTLLCLTPEFPESLSQVPGFPWLLGYFGKFAPNCQKSYGWLSGNVQILPVFNLEMSFTVFYLRYFRPSVYLLWAAGWASVRATWRTGTSFPLPQGIPPSERSSSHSKVSPSPDGRQLSLRPRGERERDYLSFPPVSLSLFEQQQSQIL
jgi:hypothetical protein